MFTRLVLFLFTYPIAVWLWSNWLIEPVAVLLGFWQTALVGFFYLPILNRLGALRYSIIVAIVTAVLIPMYFGKFWFEGSRIWGGFALSVLGLVTFASNWLYLRIMGEVSDSAGDVMSQRSFLILNAVTAISMILMGIAFAFGLAG